MKFGFPFLKHAIGNFFSKPSTVNFPAVNVDAKPGYRGRIAYYPDKCVNCGMCIKVCGPIAITRTSEDVEEGEKITYEFDLTSCTFCGMCQDFCTTKAIEMTTDYHMVAEDPKDLVVRGERIKKKVAGKLTCSDSCVYCTLCAKQCPEGAITVDRANKTWSVDEEKCVKCGICIDKCPKKSLSFAEVEEGVICSDSCVYCTLCAKKCPAEAITVDRANKTWSIDREKCTKCGICISACPKKSLSMGDINASSPCPEAADVPAPTKVEPKAEEAAPAETPANNGKLTCSDSCVYCTLCAKKCPVEAITVDRDAKTWAVDEEKCIKCGVCVEKCPKKSLSFEE
ncbi:MAG: 4Fe-4S binding protein [Oscillospiraceae bacterium]|nr:4Fe-4S binding protein [Oscillospiraceae bacterium]